MKKGKEKIDDLIKETLTKEEAKFYEDLEEPNILGKLNEVHKGKMGWLAIVMNIIHLVAFVLLIYCIFRFLDTEVIKELIRWASGGFLCMIVMGMLKLYIWMQMDKNDILREVKRLEMQVAALSNKND